MINLCQVMKMDIRESFEIYFELVEDPRSQAHITYKLSDILFMLVTGMLCSCTDLEMIIEFAEEKLDFLKKYTENMLADKIWLCYNLPHHYSNIIKRKKRRL